MDIEKINKLISEIDYLIEFRMKQIYDSIFSKYINIKPCENDLKIVDRKIKEDKIIDELFKKKTELMLFRPVIININDEKLDKMAVETINEIATLKKRFIPKGDGITDDTDAIQYVFE